MDLRRAHFCENTKVFEQYVLETTGVSGGYLVREHIRGLVQDVLKEDVELWEIEQFKMGESFDMEGFLVYLLYSHNQFSHYYFELLLFLYSGRYCGYVVKLLGEV